MLMVRRMARRETARHLDHAQLRELLQVSESEQESRTLLIRHLRMLLPDVDVAVLNPDLANDRLEITTAIGSDPLSSRGTRRSCLRARAWRCAWADRSIEVQEARACCVARSAAG